MALWCDGQRLTSDDSHEELVAEAVRLGLKPGWEQRSKAGTAYFNVSWAGALQAWRANCSCKELDERGIRSQMVVPSKVLVEANGRGLERRVTVRLTCGPGKVGTALEEAVEQARSEQRGGPEETAAGYLLAAIVEKLARQGIHLYDETPGKVTWWKRQQIIRYEQRLGVEGKGEAWRRREREKQERARELQERRESAARKKAEGQAQREANREEAVRRKAALAVQRAERAEHRKHVGWQRSGPKQWQMKPDNCPAKCVTCRRMPGGWIDAKGALMGVCEWDCVWLEALEGTLEEAGGRAAVAKRKRAEWDELGKEVQIRRKRQAIKGGK